MSTRPDPNWWPSTPEVGLLDVRDGMCSVSFLDTSSGQVERFSEPAFLRRTADGAYSHWGRRALAWKGRLANGQVCEVFARGWPSDPATARWYLKKLAETYFPKRGLCRVHLLEVAEFSWARQLWQETLEDSGFSVQGFLAPWQHDVLLAKGGRAEFALSPYLHFCLDESFTSWHLINGGKVAASASDSRLSEARLLSQIGDFLRRGASLEVAPSALRSLVLASVCWPGMRSPGRGALNLSVAGRQVHSGLPTRQTFAWSDFLATQPAVVEAWRAVKRRIFAEVADLSGGGAGLNEGLDLPGWRVLTSGGLAQLFVEGPVVRLMDAAP
jgi:hypothetical protein